MRILHLLSQTHLTGPEVYVAALVRRQARDGHRCFIVSDTLSVAVQARYMAMPLHDRRWPNRARNVTRLVRLVREEHIDLIHAHSRAASWLANVVARLTRVAYVSTVHGRQHIHASSRRFNVYGRHIIVVCEELAGHLRHDLNIKNAVIHVVRNPIETAATG